MKNTNIKRATSVLLGVVLSTSFLMTSCLDVESDRQAFEPDLNSKTDSVFYAFGIAQAMQQLGDQYYFQGEMRGELVATTQYTDSMLSQLKNFSATLTNKYDSAFVYYRVINNCNYYLTHRDRSLRTGSTDVTKNEYAAVLAYRAWAYLQLARNYGSVPFFTEPLTSISQIDDNQFPMYNLDQIADALCPELQTYAGTPVPNYGTNINIGTLNSGGSKAMNTTKIFIPVDVILGDLYLETGKYQNAANSYFNYLSTTKTTLQNLQTTLRMRSADMSYPTDLDYSTTNNNNTYTNIFTAGNSSTGLDIISYIPMAVNSLRGTVTNVPKAYGYDYYALSSAARWNENVQLKRSDIYENLVSNLDYYYYQRVTGGLPRENFSSGKYGDMRSVAIIYPNRPTTPMISDDEEEATEWINKFQSGNIIVYRVTTVFLHLCEALNRLGMPDAAFAFLKEGLTSNLTLPTTTWLSDDAKNYFLNTFLNAANEDTYKANSYPIHGHGLGATADGNYSGNSPYQFGTEITRKADELNKTIPALCPSGFDTRLTNSKLYSADLAAYDSTDPTAIPVDRNDYGPLLTKSDTIFVMEELLCDEEAMEFCFEGTRWYDLMRFARHKNRAGQQGTAWLADKVKSNNPVVSLLNESNWYLPFKK